jgi:hypothetical protein
VRALHLFAASAIALASAAAHAAPPLSTNLGTDPSAATLAASVLFSGTKSFSFALTQSSDVFGSLGYLSDFQSVDFTSIQLVSGLNTWSVATPNTGSFSFSGLLAGNYTLTISATSPGFGVYAGSLSAVPAPVPEAESLALALAGLSVVGFIAAKRREA